MTNAFITSTGQKKYPYKLKLGTKLAYVLRKYHNYAHTVWLFKTEAEAYQSYLDDILLANLTPYSKGEFKIELPPTIN